LALLNLDIKEKFRFNKENNEKNLRNNAIAVKTVIISVYILFKRVMCGLELCVSSRTARKKKEQDRTHSFSWNPL